jgi:hypothetical protein
MASSCRGCGNGEQQPIYQCARCEEIVQWKCPSCNKKTDMSIHLHDGLIAKAFEFGPRKSWTGDKRKSVAAIS